MGILSRFRDIMASNVHALLNNTKDPMKAVEEYVRSLNRDLGQIKAETSSLQADERRARRAIDENRDEMDKLQRYAERSAQSGSQSEARRFLDMKVTAEGKRAQLQKAYEAIATQALEMKQIRDKLVLDAEELEKRRDELRQRQAQTASMQRENERSADAAGQAEAFAVAEQQIELAYFEAEALAELRAQPKDDLDELIAQLQQGTAELNAASQTGGTDEELATNKQ